MLRILSTSLDKVKQFFDRLRSTLTQDVDVPQLPASVPEPMVLPERYEGVLLEDPFPEVFFDNQEAQRALKKQLNELLDNYYRLNLAALEVVKPVITGLPTKLDTEEHLLQVASQFVNAHNWPISALPLIKEIFYQQGWGATRIALNVAIENGMTVKELELCFHLKTLWDRSEHYTSHSSWKVMSWPTALYVIRSFPSYPQKEELEHLLDSWYERWLYTPSSHQLSKHFLSYVLKQRDSYSLRLNSESSDFLVSPEEIPFNNYNYPESNDIAQVQLRQRLLELGVI